ncbi:hypothetical protein ABZ953_04115 [Streptomyces sp. NPDC046465]|uniref:hypothetical protein n=1 Tax=Streptomyces sp. NPDC046465 TaxID=3155810 RepID=UPI0033E3F827
MPHEILRHPRLCSDSVRLLTWQLSLPEGVEESLSATASSAGIGRAGFNRAKRELKAEGYFHEWREQRARGRWSTRQLVSSVPLTPEQAVALRDSAPRNSGSGSGSAPYDGTPTVGEPAGQPIGGHPDATPPENTFQPSPPDGDSADSSDSADPAEPTEPTARRLIEDLPLLDPRLRVPRGILQQLAALVDEWLNLGHSTGDVLAEIRRGLPEVIHRPGGLVRYLLRDPVPPRPSRPSPSASPQAAALRECAGSHSRPTVFRPVAGEDRCGPCRQARAEAQVARVPAPGWVGAGAAARGAPAVRAALLTGRVRESRAG